MKELSSLHLNGSGEFVHIVLSYLTTSKLKTLSLSSFGELRSYRNVLSSVTNVTISSCDLDNLHILLANLPLLTYLNVHECSKTNNDPSRKICNENCCATNLTTMVIGDFDHDFQEFEQFVKLIPNLKCLSISGGVGQNILDAHRWERLITSSLPRLETFHFRFSCDSMDADDNILEIFQQFQSDFWHRAHNWYTECLLTSDNRWICTIPCPLYRCKLAVYTNSSHYVVMPADSSDTQDFTLKEKRIPKPKECHFYRITSLTFGGLEISEKCILETKDIKSLKRSMTLSGVSYLNISSDCKIAKPSVLLSILKETPKVSSMYIDQTVLLPLLVDDELCTYLIKMIKRLDLYMNWSIPTQMFITQAELSRVCKAFSNVEVLQCSISQKSAFKYLMENLPKLFHLTISMKTSEDRRIVSDWFDKELAKRNANYNIKYDQGKRTCVVTVNVWI
ncbi:unnamed protein product [Rotaria sp. Silwood2]|nr:unnamed protein product [Rotaria sp. Silwood2]